MNEVVAILRELGPCRSSKVADVLQLKYGLSSDAARQRIARAGKSIFRFPVSLLPNKETFIYLPDQRATDEFWINLHLALRETNAVYAFALDGMIARGGIVKASEFDVISGAPIALKKQVASNRVLESLIVAGALRREQFGGEECVVIERPEIGEVNRSGFKGRLSVENTVLDGIREWSRKMGMASYNSIGIRNENPQKLTIGAFKWDLAGPSYLIPLRGEKGKPGWLVADVFSGRTLDENSITYFIRKAQLLRSSQKHSRFLPMLIGDSFTGDALTKGHSAGIVLSTPDILFGRSIANALRNLLDTLNNAAAIASGNPDRLVNLIDQLSEIEGAAGNLRGVLFELISAHLAKVQGGSIDFSVNARDPQTGKTYDIDVLRVVNKGECIGIECKGKNPGGKVSLEEVEDWIHRLPMFVRYLKNEPRFAEATLKFELWTSGTFTSEALNKLQAEKNIRKKVPISWKDGDAVFSISNSAKEKKITETLKEHFLRHPLSKAGNQ